MPYEKGEPTTMSCGSDPMVAMNMTPCDDGLQTEVLMVEGLE